MQPSVRAMLTGIIDYAGLFPPARLELQDALDEFLAHASSPDGWMLARFVVPAARLGELVPLLGTSGMPEAGIRLAVLGRGGTSAAGLATGLTADISDIESFLEAASGRALIDQLEIRLPDGPAEIPAAVTGALERLEAVPSAVPFFEASLLDGWRGRLPGTTAALAAGRRPAGLKIRCGGLEAAAVPSPVAVAAALAACRRANVPLKATQGLHHPVRHFDPRLETTVHGFLNVFVAGVLGASHALPEERLLEIVVEEDPTAFRFDRGSVGWRDLAATIEEIAAGRSRAATSFGSCSFTEPRDDLRALGLLDGAGTS